MFLGMYNDVDGELTDHIPSIIRQLEASIWLGGHDKQHTDCIRVSIDSTKALDEQDVIIKYWLLNGAVSGWEIIVRDGLTYVDDTGVRQARKDVTVNQCYNLLLKLKRLYDLRNPSGMEV
ncbi:hypothetical protein GCM10011378_43300 [Hymenobacter glacieicola]|uniref:Uncharacterized protein n=1 Tax=Hymenobacter glacieicola TaxID=1562124 RepID=A0ABQ1X6R3_9BACT|nr:hypothetical protein GCM10011378_43300 [Hymenobacter glacieicola]